MGNMLRKKKAGPENRAVDYIAVQVVLLGTKGMLTKQQLCSHIVSWGLLSNFEEEQGHATSFAPRTSGQFTVLWE